MKEGDLIVCIMDSELPEGVIPIYQGRIYKIRGMRSARYKDGTDSLGLYLEGINNCKVPGWHEEWAYKAFRFRKMEFKSMIKGVEVQMENFCLTN